MSARDKDAFSFSVSFDDVPYHAGSTGKASGQSETKPSTQLKADDTVKWQQLYEQAVANNDLLKHELDSCRALLVSESSDLPKDASVLQLLHAFVAATHTQKASLKGENDILQTLIQKKNSEIVEQKLAIERFDTIHAELSADIEELSKSLERERASLSHDGEDKELERLRTCLVDSLEREKKLKDLFEEEVTAHVAAVSTAAQREKKLRDKVALAEARAEQAEDKVFEAMQAVEVAEQDAIQADLDAEVYERIYKTAIEELSETRLQLNNALANVELLKSQLKSVVRAKHRASLSEAALEQLIASQGQVGYTVDEKPPQSQHATIVDEQVSNKEIESNVFDETSSVSMQADPVQAVQVNSEQYHVQENQEQQFQQHQEELERNQNRQIKEQIQDQEHLMNSVEVQPIKNISDQIVLETIAEVVDNSQTVPARSQSHPSALPTSTTQVPNEPASSQTVIDNPSESKGSKIKSLAQAFSAPTAIKSATPKRSASHTAGVEGKRIQLSTGTSEQPTISNEAKPITGISSAVPVVAVAPTSATPVELAVPQDAINSTSTTSTGEVSSSVAGLASKFAAFGRSMTTPTKSTPNKIHVHHPPPSATGIHSDPSQETPTTATKATTSTTAEHTPVSAVIVAAQQPPLTTTAAAVTTTAPVISTVPTIIAPSKVPLRLGNVTSATPATIAPKSPLFVRAATATPHSAATTSAAPHLKAAHLPEVFAVHTHPTANHATGTSHAHLHAHTQDHTVNLAEVSTNTHAHQRAQTQQPMHVQPPEHSHPVHIQQPIHNQHEHAHQPTLLQPLEHTQQQVHARKQEHSQPPAIIQTSEHLQQQEPQVHVQSDHTQPMEHIQPPIQKVTDTKHILPPPPPIDSASTLVKPRRSISLSAVLSAGKGTQTNTLNAIPSLQEQHESRASFISSAASVASRTVEPVETLTASAYTPVHATAPHVVTHQKMPPPPPQVHAQPNYLRAEIITPQTIVLPESKRVRKTDPAQQTSAATAKKHGKAGLLAWCQQMTQGRYEITNFSGSFADGLAFCAIMASVFPNRVPYEELNAKSRARNFTLAFKLAEEAGVDSLLDVEDMVAMERPDPLSVMTYCNFLYKRFGK